MAVGIRIGTALAAGVLAAGVAAAPAAASCPGAQLHAAAQSIPQFEQSLHCLINERRTAAGRATLRHNHLLRLAASRHSADMVERSYFAHDTPEGVSFIDRVKRTGYTRRAVRWILGENLVWGNGTLSTPHSLVQAWMNSPPHRENLLRSRFRDLGVAVSRGTPKNALDLTGVTVTSEYGFRKFRKKLSRKARRAKAKKAKVRKARKARKRARR